MRKFVTKFNERYGYRKLDLKTLRGEILFISRESDPHKREELFTTFLKIAGCNTKQKSWKPILEYGLSNLEKWCRKFNCGETLKSL